MSARATWRLASDERCRDRIVDEARLDRVLLADDHLEPRLLDPRLDLAERVLGDDQRTEHVAVAHELLGLLARRDAHRLDVVAHLVAEIPSRSGPVPTSSDCPRGTSFTSATRGFSDPRLSVSPISSATTSG